MKAHLEQVGVMTLPWPPQGADLNIIENVWGIMKRNLSRMGLHHATSDELWEAVKGEWELLEADTDLVPALYESLPRRMAGVVQSDGACLAY